MCLSAPAGDASSESDEYLSEDKIENLRSRLNVMSGMNSQSVEDFIGILRKFTKGTTEKEKLEGAVSVYLDYCFIIN